MIDLSKISDENLLNLDHIVGVLFRGALDYYFYKSYLYLSIEQELLIYIQYLSNAVEEIESFHIKIQAELSNRLPDYDKDHICL